MSSVLVLDNVYKKYGKIDIIKGVSFDVKEGEIYGFLGPNGAGKTTTIRMVTGLIKPDKGNILINGFNIQKQFVHAMDSVGAIVENPDMYGDFTGRQNLNIFAKLYGNVDKKRIDEVIEIIGLKDRIDDKVKKYSLGMKQRLGLGQALLPNPKLLILDEPTNGLDPSGIVDFRKIVKDVVSEFNTAVLVSSHILAEVEQLCSKVAFIDKGKIVSIESINNLKSDNKEHINIKVSEIEKAKNILKELDFIDTIEAKDNLLALICNKDSFPNVIKTLTLNDIDIHDVYKVKQNLENRFMEITEGVK
ncbi:ABC transporter ATP-binding protein [Clostridium senegalense]|uniref:ABC transporter ATP-binding protein n=1 Tax=Clostridium senegalense TaxID=1465809 RepID=A0A6M0H0N4_9CLOT|nr:ABC transporter ATP-binding protein [Clostridium senegalense]NEU04149.1 ABC transporter ATP-binding protein [Clostridium senegalense]